MIFGSAGPQVRRCYIPALFVVATADPIVEPHHGRQLHAAYAGDKNLIEVPRRTRARDPRRHTRRSPRAARAR